MHVDPAGPRFMPNSAARPLHELVAAFNDEEDATEEKKHKDSSDSEVKSPDRLTATALKKLRKRKGAPGGPRS